MLPDHHPEPVTTSRVTPSVLNRVRPRTGLGLLASLALLLNHTAHALPLQETVYCPDMPTAWIVDEWSRSPQKRGYRISAGDPSSQELKVLADFTHYSRLEVSIRRPPSPSEASVWRTLAARGVQLNILEGILPSLAELQFIDSLGFQKVLFVITGPQDPTLTQALGELKTPVSLTLAARAYPKYMDKESWVTIPPQVPLTVSTDFWPGYTQMDMLNLMSMSQSLRVKDMFPNEDSYPYLLNIKRLEQITIDTDFDPWDQGQVWQKLGAKKVRWNRRSNVPSKEVLEAFARSAAPSLRSVTIDTDIELSREERKRLEDLPIPVEWLRSQN